MPTKAASIFGVSGIEGTVINSSLLQRFSSHATMYLIYSNKVSTCQLIEIENLQKYKSIETSVLFLFYRP